MTVTILRYGDDGFKMDTLKSLFRAYQAFQMTLGIDLAFQNFEQELAALPGRYHPEQGGQLYLANWDGKTAGCCAFYELRTGVCELKRLYVDPDFQGKQVGYALITAAMADAARVGYETMLLDSVKRLAAAEKLYLKLGFSYTQPFNTNPQPDVYYMNYDLTGMRAKS